MKTTLLLFGAIMLLLLVHPIESQQITPSSPKRIDGRPGTAGDEWKIAKFKGLIMGKSTKQDALRILGKPDWEGYPEEASEANLWLEYDSVSEHNWRGKLTVALDRKKGVISSILFYPADLDKSDLVDYLGRNFVTHRYAFEPCDEGSGGSARIYESENGQLEFIEYRSRE